MKLNHLKLFSYFILAVVLTLGLSLSLQSLLAAWTAPLASPPGCTAGNPGCDAPLNIGALMQVKSGALWLNTNGISPHGLIVENGNVGIGTTSPVQKLDINGGIKIGDTPFCVNGTIKYNGDFAGCKNGQWVQFTTTIIATAPTVTTLSAGSITQTTVTLNGSAIPNLDSTTGWFRYSSANPGVCNDTFGTRAPASGGSALGNGTGAVAYSQSVSGLSANTTYYYCALASNSKGTGVGNIIFFTTPAPLPFCGDHSCNGSDTCSNCPGDCGACAPFCGDYSCNGSETCSTCPNDCGVCAPYCGDGSCNGNETCKSCPSDCPNGCLYGSLHTPLDCSAAGGSVALAGTANALICKFSGSGAVSCPSGWNAYSDSQGYWINTVNNSCGSNTSMTRTGDCGTKTCSTSVVTAPGKGWGGSNNVYTSVQYFSLCTDYVRTYNYDNGCYVGPDDFGGWWWTYNRNPLSNMYVWGNWCGPLINQRACY